MNKDEIKKAFDICFSAQKSCNGCPLLVLEKQNGHGCKYNLFTSVFDLITEQEEEIEQLKSECEYRKKQHDSQVLENTRLYIEYDKLKDDYAKLQELFAQYQMASDKEIIAQKKQAEKRFENNMKAVLEIEKKQAVQDFAEKLKEKARGLTLEGNKGAGFYIGNILLTNDIDELLKEI